MRSRYFDVPLAGGILVALLLSLIAVGADVENTRFDIDWLPIDAISGPDVAWIQYVDPADGATKWQVFYCDLSWGGSVKIAWDAWGNAALAPDGAKMVVYHYRHTSSDNGYGGWQTVALRGQYRCVRFGGIYFQCTYISNFFDGIFLDEPVW